MADIEKVTTGLELCTNITPDGCLMLCPYKDEQDETYSGFCEHVLKQDALKLLKEQKEREQAICKEICDFIRSGCSTDTEDDKDYVCNVIQNCFKHYCADGEHR